MIECPETLDSLCIDRTAASDVTFARVWEKVVAALIPKSKLSRRRVPCPLRPRVLLVRCASSLREPPDYLRYCTLITYSQT
jgi:hypothetical protein